MFRIISRSLSTNGPKGPVQEGIKNVQKEGVKAGGKHSDAASFRQGGNGRGGGRRDGKGFEGRKFDGKNQRNDGKFQGNRNNASGNKYAKFSKRVERIDPLFGRPLIRDPETGIMEGGRLCLCLGQQPNSELIPLNLRQKIYEMYQEDPDKQSCLQRIAAKVGIRTAKVQGIIKLVAHEKSVEREMGEALNQQPDIDARKYFGEKTNFEDHSLTDADDKMRELLARKRYFTTLYPGEPDPESTHRSKLKSTMEIPWKIVNIDKIRGAVVKNSNGFICRRISA